MTALGWNRSSIGPTSPDTQAWLSCWTVSHGFPSAVRRFNISPLPPDVASGAGPPPALDEDRRQGEPGERRQHTVEGLLPGCRPTAAADHDGGPRSPGGDRQEEGREVDGRPGVEGGLILEEAVAQFGAV